jgi:hypothetical protein
LAQDGPTTTKEKKKSRIKKNKTAKEGMNGPPPHPIPFHPSDDPLDFSGLQILSKAEWKKLRNTYLNLQRSNMAQVNLFELAFVISGNDRLSVPTLHFLLNL